MAFKLTLGCAPTSALIASSMVAGKFVILRIGGFLVVEGVEVEEDVVEEEEEEEEEKEENNEGTETGGFGNDGTGGIGDDLLPISPRYICAIIDCATEGRCCISFAENFPFAVSFLLLLTLFFN